MYKTNYVQAVELRHLEKKSPLGTEELDSNPINCSVRILTPSSQERHPTAHTAHIPLV